jgi:hypothetical protein
VSEHATRDEQSARSARLAARAAVPKRGYHVGLGADEATPARVFLAAAGWGQALALDALPAGDVLGLL